ncbi:MAG TPA: hypothetical protein VNO32_57150 [Candidatus Acidoferrum sp.]|nr:hypothetical protein [Candidatus Acidoferrum sp.]
MNDLNDGATYAGIAVAFHAGVLFADIPGLHAQTKKLTKAQARDHVADRATVSGKVVSSHYPMSSKGEPTFFNLDEPYLKEILTILIGGSNREKFGAPGDSTKDCP